MFTRLAALAAITFFALPAFADESPPPAAGSTASFQSVVCDTSAQISAIIDAAKATPDGGAQAKFTELHALVDAKGEATCAFQPLPNVSVSENIDLGKVQLVAGKWVHAWAVHIGSTGGADGWLLYVTETTAPASLDVPALLPHGLRAI